MQYNAFSFNKNIAKIFQICIFNKLVVYYFQKIHTKLTQIQLIYVQLHLKMKFIIIY